MTRTLSRNHERALDGAAHAGRSTRTAPRSAVTSWLVVTFVATSLSLAACGDGSAQLGPAIDGAVDTTKVETTSPQDTVASDTDQDTSAPPQGVQPPTTWSDVPVGLRTEVEVCAAWTATQESAVVQHAPAAGCVAGAMTWEARQDAMLRLNFYRWLVGLEFAYEATPYLPSLQQCAFYMSSNGLPVSHQPDTTQACYSEEVSSTAAVSNLASSVTSAQHAIDTFTLDAAHRVLLLAPGLGSTAIGYFEEVACQVVFGENWIWDPPVHRTIAYPAPGPNPQAPTRVFTIQPGTGHDFDEQTSVQVVQGGMVVAATVALEATSYETDVLSVTLPETPGLGEIYQVSVQGIATGSGRVDETYSTRFVRCE